MIRKALGKLNITLAVFLSVIIVGSFSAIVYASGTSTFSQTINAGSLAIDIVDSGYSTVGSPGITMSAETFSFSCQTADGTFGATEEMIYVMNPDAADSGWVVSLAASATTDVWDSAGTDFDFNDDTGSGCTDGGDADDLGGQMTVDASGGTLAEGACSVCDATDVTKGTTASFIEGSTDTITILTGAADSDDIGDWTLQGVTISQEIPAEQAAASDYTIDMVLSIAAS
jgi:hypothetical protein